MVLRFLSAGLFIVALLTACSNKVTAPLVSTMHTEPMHHKWRITEVKGSSESIPYIYIDLRNILNSHASAGCDSIVFTPKYSYNNRIDFSNTSVAMRKCKGNTQIDNLFLSNLKEVYFFSVSANQLTLLDKSNNKLFEAVYDADDEQGTLLRNWEITKMMNSWGDSFLVAKPYINFTDVNHGKAYAGCNTLSFPVTLTGAHDISIGSVASTRMYCKDNANEEVLSKILPLIKMHQVVGNTLKLFDKDNELLIEAVAPLQ